MAESLFSHWDVAKIFAHLWGWEMLKAGLPLSVSYKQAYKGCLLTRLRAVLVLEGGPAFVEHGRVPVSVIGEYGKHGHGE